MFIFCKKSNFRPGFTLVEVMVSIVIVGTIMGMSVAIFETAKNKKTAETVAREVADKLAEAHADAMVPSDTKTGLKKVSIECDSDKLTEKYLGSAGAVLGSFELYNFPSKVTAICPTTSIDFEANDGIKLGQITSTGDPIISIEKNIDTYRATIDIMSGAVNVEKQ